MQLNNLYLLHTKQPVQITLEGGRILSVSQVHDSGMMDPFQIQFKNALAIPGLINSHDHLDFNCFPVFGDRIYNNYTEWGKHIHEEFKDPIEDVLDIPQNLRISWGIYKNLLAGITTVVNHGKFLQVENPLITVYQEPQNIHSVQFEKHWKWKINNPIHSDKDVVIHAGEGLDEPSSREIDQLIRFNLLGRKLVGVHGVAMNEQQAKNFKAIIWCPESNRVLLNQHAPISSLKKATRIVFGTDSTLTGNWNIWNHLRLARSLRQASDSELYDMVTNSPAELWNLNKGVLAAGKDADIVVINKKKPDPDLEGLFSTNPEEILLVIHQGNIRLFDSCLLQQLSIMPIHLRRYSQVRFRGVTKFVEGDLPALIHNIKRYHPDSRLSANTFENQVQLSYD